MTSTTGSDYWAANIGGAKIKTDGLKPQTQTHVITHKWPILPQQYRYQYPIINYLDSDNEDEVENIPQKNEPDEEKTDATLNGEIEILDQGMNYLPSILNDKYLVLSAL